MLNILSDSKFGILNFELKSKFASSWVLEVQGPIIPIKNSQIGNLSIIKFFFKENCILNEN